MDQVTEVLELSSEDIKLRHLIVDLLSEVFNEVFSDAEVEPFGSTVNQFGTKYSDLDLCLVTNELAPYPNQYTCPAESNVANDDESLPEPTKLVPDEICDKSNGDEDDVESTVKNISSMEESMATVAEILKRFVPGCKHVLSVQSAHCPVIKFTHVDSGLNCDLSINNR